MLDKKIAFIYGSTDDNRGIKEGQIEMIGDAHDEDELHIKCIMDYTSLKYSDLSMFKQLNERHTPETFAYFYTLLGHIVFFNNTKNIEKYGKLGLLMMPKNITEIQKQSLYEFIETIPDFSIVISYDFKVEDGFLEDKEMSSVNKESPKDLLDKYFDKVEELSVKPKHR